MSSGLSLDENAIKKLDEFKIPKKGSPKLTAAIFRLNSGMTAIEFDSYIQRDSSLSSSEEHYNSVIKSLPKNECRYVIVTIEMKHPDGRISEKLVFISWCPEEHVSSKQKMVFASSKEVLRHRCSDMKEFFVTTPEDLPFRDICDKLL